MRIIKIKIKNGIVSADAIGFQGKSCEDVTKFIELLGDVVHEEKKQEYYIVESGEVQIKKASE